MMMGDSNSTSGGFCVGSGRVMLNGFQMAADGNPCVLYLFKGAVVDSETKYAFAVIGTFFMAIVVEMFRWTRSHVSSRHFSFTKKWGTLTIEASVFVLYVAHMCLAYWLMLLVMLYEYVIFIAIIFGLGVGLLIARDLDRSYFPRVAATPNGGGGTPCCDGCSCSEDQTTVHFDKSKQVVIDSQTVV